MGTKKEKSWPLSEYDLQRTPQRPHEVNPDGELEIEVSSDSIFPEFICSICLDIFKRAMAVKECLHRFCYDCILKHLRIVSKTCPICRIVLKSKRYLRPDTKLDAMIAKLYPTMDEDSEQQMDVVQVQDSEQSSDQIPSTSTSSVDQDMETNEDPGFSVENAVKVVLKPHPDIKMPSSWFMHLHDMNVQH